MITSVPRRAALPARKIIPLIAFGLMALSAIPVNLAFLRAEQAARTALNPTIERLTKGKVADALTIAYNASSPFKDAGINLFGSLSFLAFHELRSGAQMGSTGWIFSNEEFETSATSRVMIDKALAHVSDVQKRLAARDIALIVAPLPLKADIENAYLGGTQLGAELTSRYAYVQTALKAAGISTVDLKAAFLLGRINRPVFLRTDTHWTPDGARVTAETIAKAAAVFNLPGEKSFVLTHDLARAHDGDLLKFVRLFPALANIGPGMEMIEPVTAASAEAGDLFAEVALPVTLVGTSYSANAVFGFEAQLKAALKRDVLNVSEEGKGPFAPMRAYLSSDAYRNTPPKLVIWEMPIRYLDDVFPAADMSLPNELP